MNNKSPVGKFCDYRGSHLAICGMFVTDGLSRCKRHKLLIEKSKNKPGIKFRGSSKFAKDHGLFLGVEE